MPPLDDALERYLRDALIEGHDSDRRRSAFRRGADRRSSIADNGRRLATATP